MAEVDFSNAVIEAYGNTPFANRYISFNDGNLNITNASGTNIAPGGSRTVLVDDYNQFTIRHSGTLNESGTAMYFSSNGIRWKISGISFASGDTFTFTTSADLVEV